MQLQTRRVWKGAVAEKGNKRDLEAASFLPPCDPIWSSPCVQSIFSLSLGQQPWPSGQCQSQHGNDIIPDGTTAAGRAMGGLSPGERSLGCLERTRMLLGTIHAGQADPPPSAAWSGSSSPCTGMCRCANEPRLSSNPHGMPGITSTGKGPAAPCCV